MISKNKQQNNAALVDSTGTKGANLEGKCLFYVLAALTITKMERKTTSHYVFTDTITQSSAHFANVYFFA